MAHSIHHALGAVIASTILAVAGAAAAQEAPKWVVDPAHSTLAFESSAEGAAFEGHFDHWTADIHFDPQALANSKVTVEVDTASVATGDSGRDQSAQGGDWFFSAMFPKAVFVSKSIKDLGGGKYEADGDLTLRDKTLPLALPFTLSIKGNDATMHSEIDIDRSAWGFGTGEYGSADIVPLKVGLRVDLVAHKAG